MVVIARVEDGQDCVLPQKVTAPDEMPLAEVDALIRHAKEAPIDEVPARVVEVASGLRFDDFLQSRIFDPLQIVDIGQGTITASTDADVSFVMAMQTVRLIAVLFLKEVPLTSNWGDEGGPPPAAMG